MVSAEKSLDWRSLLEIAYIKTKESHDSSTQNAALLINRNGRILAADINRFPDGVKETEERWQRPLKYKFIEHAEITVLYAAAKNGIPTQDLIMVCPWAPCTDCARAIILSGVKLLVTHQQAHERSPKHWRDDIKLAFKMLKEAGVEVIMYDGEIGVKNLRHSGQLWNP